MFSVFFFFQAEDGIRDKLVTGVQTCALPIWHRNGKRLAMRDRAQRRRAEPVHREDGERYQIGGDAGGRHRAAGAYSDDGKMPLARPRGHAVSWSRRADEAAPTVLHCYAQTTLLCYKPHATLRLIPWQLGTTVALQF